MAHRMKPSHPDDKTAPALFWSTIALAFLGAADSVYLLILKLTQAVSMCVGNHSCITVNNSVYSEIYGIPVSVFGICAYLAILVILFLEERFKIANDNGPLVVFGISLGGVAFSIYLTYIEIYVIHAICPFCVASAIIITLIFILAIFRLVKQLGN
jgi:uncharacterized membrane protein